jgi:phosphatidate cytidylyltransferase
MTRILTALVAVPLLLAVLLLGPAWMFLALVLVCAVAGYWELTVLSDRAGWKPLAIGYPLVVLLVAAFYPGAPGLDSVALLLVVLVGSSAVLSREPSRETLGALAMTVFGALYVGSLAGSVLGVRMVAPDREGRSWTILLLAVVMVGDAGAFFVGRAFGRTPLAPVLSPKKTVAGLVGGALFSVATALALGSTMFHSHYRSLSLSLSTFAGIGLGLSLLGVVGDLFESLLKRSAGMKDTSSLIPGHGGVLDRIDSLLFAAPVLLLFLRWLGLREL